MQVIRSLNDTLQISNAAIRALVRERINDLGGDAFNADELGYFLVVEVGDTLEGINAQLGFDILSNRWTGLRYDHADFTPSFEFVEEFPSYYELLFILSDSGYGVSVVASKEDGIDPDLLAMCLRYAVKEDMP